MAKNKFKLPLPVIIALIVLAFLIGLFFRSGFISSEKDFLFIENTCRDLKFQEWDKLSPKIVNTGNKSAYVKTCLSSEQFTFENFDHSYCLKEEKLQGLNNSLEYEIQINTVPEFEDAKRASIQVEISCKKHFLFFRKDCGKINYNCNFDKVNLLGVPA